MHVLSLFDGIGCGRVALDRANIPVTSYYASEVYRHAIAVAKHHYPDVIHVGDVCTVRADSLPRIDLLIGGSPCQGFSSAGKGLNFSDPRSALFFEFVRILKDTQPRYFLFENVPMRPAWQDTISDALGVAPIGINSKLMSAQDRKRLYWTNIPGVAQPDDKHIPFSSIVVDSMTICGAVRGRRINPSTGCRDDRNADLTYEQCIECRMDKKSNCLTTVAKDNVALFHRTPRVLVGTVPHRILDPIEYERLQTLPDQYTAIAPLSARREMLANAWTVDVIAHIFQHIPREQ